MKDLFEPLTDAELDELDRLLLDLRGEEEAVEGGDPGILGVSELDGFFAAIVSGPEVVLPSRWLNAVWGDDPPEWASEAQFERAISLMMRHMNEVAAALMDPEFEFDPLFYQREFEGTVYTVVDDWCVGYLRGMFLTAEAWDAGGEDLVEFLAPIMLFGGEPGWQMLDEMGDESAEAMQALIPGAAQALHGYWLDRREPYEPLPEPVTRTAPNVGRNDPCPCGSGKKYKKCCLR